MRPVLSYLFIILGLATAWTSGTVQICVHNCGGGGGHPPHKRATEREAMTTTQTCGPNAPS
jgi:hypothetical protein